MVRLISYLKEQGLSNRDAQRALEHGKIFLGDIPTADGGRDIEPGQVVVRLDAPRLIVGRDPVVVWSDAELAVVYKPAGVLAVAAAGRKRDGNIVSMMAKRFGQAHPVHRLDEETSGLMLVALTPRAQERLKNALEHRWIERRYLAIVRNHFPDDGIHTFDTIMVRNRGDGKRGSEPDPERQREGKRAVTHIRLCQVLPRHASLVEARLESGRTHQVRIHLAEAGYPVLGDGLYGGLGVARASRRLALHAWHLAFEHPESGAPLSFVAPLADDLETLRRRLSHAGRY